MKSRGKFQPDRPWQLPHIEDHDIFALQAVAKGIGSEAQQQRAYGYIVRVLCETERMTFWPRRGRRQTRHRFRRREALGRAAAQAD